MGGGGVGVEGEVGVRRCRERVIGDGWGGDGLMRTEGFDGVASIFGELVETEKPSLELLSGRP